MEVKDCIHIFSRIDIQKNIVLNLILSRSYFHRILILHLAVEKILSVEILLNT